MELYFRFHYKIKTFIYYYLYNYNYKTKYNFKIILIIGEMEMNFIKELNETIIEYDQTGNQLNSVTSKLRRAEFDLKTRKLELEFDPEFTDGLKVKEIPHKVHMETLEEARKICSLKEERDVLEHELKVLKYEIYYLREVIDSQK